jgi:hypothetical protein
MHIVIYNLCTVACCLLNVVVLIISLCSTLDTFALFPPAFCVLLWFSYRQSQPYFYFLVSFLIHGFRSRSSKQNKTCCIVQMLHILELCPSCSVTRLLPNLNPEASFLALASHPVRYGTCRYRPRPSCRASRLSPNPNASFIAPTSRPALFRLRL